MYAAPGIGLVQVGILKRVIVIDVSKQDEKGLILSELNNIQSEKTSVYEEGCLLIKSFCRLEDPECH